MVDGHRGLLLLATGVTMTEFFTGDQHFWHDKIIEYCKRPFDSLKEMHNKIIGLHNALVTDDDTVWHIGDFAMAGPEKESVVRAVFNKLKGQHHLIVGNHDEIKPLNYVNMGFVSVHSAMWFERQGINFYLIHDPASYTVVSNFPNAVLLCGHIHTLFKHLLPAKKIINVGVDAWDFKPVSMDEIISLLKNHNVV